MTPLPPDDLDVIERSARFFDEVHVVVVRQRRENTDVSEATRVDVIRRALD